MENGAAVARPAYEAGETVARDPGRVLRLNSPGSLSFYRLAPTDAASSTVGGRACAPSRKRPACPGLERLSAPRKPVGRRGRYPLAPPTDRPLGPSPPRRWPPEHPLAATSEREGERAEEDVCVSLILHTRRTRTSNIKDTAAWRRGPGAAARTTPPPTTTTSRDQQALSPSLSWLYASRPKAAAPFPLGRRRPSVRPRSSIQSGARSEDGRTDFDGPDGSDRERR